MPEINAKRPQDRNYAERIARNTPIQGSAADILKLAQAAGRWAGIYSALGVPARWVEPAQWKGQIPKPKRGETYIIEKRVLEVLSPPERAVLDLGCKGLCASKRHNVIDAVGIGHWVRKNGKS